MVEPILTASAVAKVTSTIVKTTSTIILKEIYDTLKKKYRIKVEETELNKKIDVVNSKLSSLTLVKTIKNLDESVQINSFFYPPYLQKIDSSTKIEPHNLKDLGSQNNNFLILGTVGQGKSILMRYLASKELESTGRIPVFIELRKIHKDEKLLTKIFSVLSELISFEDKEKLEFLLSEGKIVLFLDGFDEVTSEKSKSILNEIESLNNKYEDKLQIILTSRIDNLISNSNIFTILKMCKLTLIEQKGIISRIIVDRENREKLVEAIRNSSSDIKKLLTTPLLVTLFIWTYTSAQIIPKNATEFYQDIFGLVLSRHDNVKIYERSRYSEITNDKFRQLFEAISYISLENQKISFNERFFIETIKRALKFIRIDEDPEKIKNDITKCLCLILPDGKDYSFIHKSIAEYFAACFIKNHGNPKPFYSKLSQYYQKFSVMADFLEVIDTTRYVNEFYQPTIDKLIELKSNDQIYKFIYIKTNRGVNRSLIFGFPDELGYFNYYLSNNIGNTNREVIGELLDIESGKIKTLSLEILPNFISNNVNCLNLSDQKERYQSLVKFINDSVEELKTKKEEFEKLLDQKSDLNIFDL